jgi:alkanesulfonate monooxygenase SsuD/methylene tetrahydromethanopterin reductase-like flavin-dependent oxidoreductase (luciferase family)
VCIGGGAPRELGAYGVARNERVPRLTETMEVVRRLWREDAVTFRGRFHRLDEVRALPKPVQAPPPIYLSSDSRAVGWP